ncbi:MAG: TonB-dependent receptor [Bacteroidales bacterium]|nr:TonB-dependent receptor [Bacteroidales bacterium]
MTKSICLITFFLILSIGQAQEIDTLLSKKVDLQEVVVTATLTKRNLGNIPAQVALIKAKEIENFPVNNIDDLLKTTANVYVNRSWGIFSKNSSVTMRGLESSARTLVLVDGVPKNKIAGGSVNWHNINPDQVERIEIIKGPASSLYGNNAMGGVINIITKKSEEKLEGSFKTFYGTYNSFGESMQLSGSAIKLEKGFYWNVNDFYRQGDGYVFEAPAYLDATDIKTALNEYGGGFKTGYQFNKTNSLEIVYNYYNEKRGAGRKVFLDDGSFDSYLTNELKSIYTGKIGKADVKAIVYYNLENYYAQKESFNDYSEYKLLDSYANRSDQGFWATYSNSFFRKNYLTMGVELKMGDVNGSEIYRTSPDEIYFQSKMDIFGLFVQDEVDLIGKTLQLIAGVRMDFIRFYDGYQSIVNPTKVTGFQESFEERFVPNNWQAMSPKIAFQYAVNRNSKLYVSASKGYMPPTLKDLSQTGKITKGFRLANPNLKPETLTNYELGFSKLIADKLNVNGAVYYTIGKDFNYMMGTGDSIDTGGSSLKPLLLTENVAQVGIFGAEISFNYHLNDHFSVQTNYAFNNSTITDFKSSDLNPEKDLTGKYMVETSPHLFYAGMNYKSSFFDANLNCNYVDEQWFDDENTIKIDAYFVANLRISKTLKKHYKFYVDIQNLFDNAFIDRKGQVSPGRFITAGFQYSFINNFN